MLVLSQFNMADMFFAARMSFEQFQQNLKRGKGKQQLLRGIVELITAININVLSQSNSVVAL